MSVDDERLVIWEGSKSVGDLLYKGPGVASIVVIVGVFCDVEYLVAGAIVAGCAMN